jgi:hypothetical protein
MPNFDFAEIQRRNNRNTIQNVKSIQEANKNYIDRENQVNGVFGSASQILSRITAKTCTATFGGNGGNCVGK